MKFGVCILLATAAATEASVVVTLTEDTVTNLIYVVAEGSIDTSVPGFTNVGTGTGVNSSISLSGLQLAPTVAAGGAQGLCSRPTLHSQSASPAY